MPKQVPDASYGHTKNASEVATRFPRGASLGCLSLAWHPESESFNVFRVPAQTFSGEADAAAE